MPRIASMATRRRLPCANNSDAVCSTCDGRKIRSERALVKNGTCSRGLRSVEYRSLMLWRRPPALGPRAMEIFNLLKRLWKSADRKGYESESSHRRFHSPGWWRTHRAASHRVAVLPAALCAPWFPTERRFARRTADWGSCVGKYTVGRVRARRLIRSNVALETYSSGLTPSTLPASISRSS
jgi:hypothetical protein